MFSLFKKHEAWQVARCVPLHAEKIAGLHSASFSRGWSEEEVLSLLRDTAVSGDILFRKHIAPDIDGFALSRHAAGEAEILSIAVAETVRGKGGGRILLQQHLGHLLTKGIRRVVLEVEDGNTAAITLYKRFGFEQVGERLAYYAKPDGSRANAKVMALAFK